MKHAIALVLYSLFATSASATMWVEVTGTNAGDLAYIDVESIVIETKTQRKAWVKYVRMKPYFVEHARREAMSGLELIAYRCDAKQQSIRQGVFYDVEGNSFAPYQYTDNRWTDIVPDTIGAELYRAACAWAPPKAKGSQNK